MTKEEIIKMAKQAGFERLGHTAEDWVCHFEDIEEFTKLVADFTKNSQPEQEPLAWISTGTARMIHWTADKPAYGDDWVPLYTAPPQRKPQYDKTEMNCFVQDLYEKKIQEGKHGQYEAMFHVVHRAIEAAYGIKE